MFDFRRKKLSVYSIGKFGFSVYNVNRYDGVLFAEISNILR